VGCLSISNFKLPRIQRQFCQHVLQTCTLSEALSAPSICECLQRRRLVINIRGEKIWVTNIEGKKFRKNIFSDNILKKILKNILLFSKISDDFFFSHRQLFSKMYTLHSKFTLFSLYFFSLSLFLLLSFMFFYKIKKIKNYRLIIGGQKGVLIIGGTCPGCPPESPPMNACKYCASQ